DWGNGHITLIEIPTPQEVHDNIVVFWEPETTMQAGEQYNFKYRMHWGPHAPYELEEGRIADTGRGKALDGDEVVFVIDFTNGRAVPDAKAGPEADEVRAEPRPCTVPATRATLLDSPRPGRGRVTLGPVRGALGALRVRPRRERH